MHPFGGGPSGQGGSVPEFLLRGPHHHGPGPLMWAMFAMELVLLIGVVWLVASSFRRGPRFKFRGGPGFGPGIRHFGPPAPADVLHLRYAHGEISREEYLQARDDLGAPPPPPEAAASS